MRKLKTKKIKIKNEDEGKETEIEVTEASAFETRNIVLESLAETGGVWTDETTVILEKKMTEYAVGNKIKPKIDINNLSYNELKEITDAAFAEQVTEYAEIMEGMVKAKSFRTDTPDVRNNVSRKKRK